MSRIICVCSQIDEETIRAVIRRGDDTIEAIQEATTANTSCMGCTRRIHKIIEEETKKD